MCIANSDYTSMIIIRCVVEISKRTSSAEMLWGFKHGHVSLDSEGSPFPDKGVSD